MRSRQGSIHIDASCQEQASGYADIDAPSSLCDGQTEDGCQLRWQEVKTLEGPEQYQCVAYCPWQ
jgi:hypothetical protein